MIDTHCHLNDSKLLDRADEVVSNFLQAGVDKAICVSYDFESSVTAQKLAEKFDCVFYSVGIHPDNCAEFDYNKLENLIINANSKIVAVGEIGLDYFHNKDNKAEQKEVFIKQIELANKYNLPIIIHCREAYGDTLEILKQFAPFKYGAVMHCYGGSLEYANELIKLGVKISFTGTVTFKNAVNVKEVAKNIPLDSFFVETDSPYLTPEPNRGKLNEPKYVIDVAKYIAQLRDMSYDEIVSITDNNAKKFFQI